MSEGAGGAVGVTEPEPELPGLEPVEVEPEPVEGFVPPPLPQAHVSGTQSKPSPQSVAVVQGSK